MDGAGNPWFRADVAVKDGRIAAIGRPADRSAARTIDAHERVVAPGFIDVHTNIEGGIERNPRGDNFLLDGVTTVITCNCGGSELNLAAELVRSSDRLAAAIWSSPAPTARPHRRVDRHAATPTEQTAPVLDPTDEGAQETCDSATPCALLYRSPWL
jgi:imidazolonepropionase-like amidohydrolase